MWLFEHPFAPENVILDAPTIRSILSSWFEWFHVGVEKLLSRKQPDQQAALVFFSVTTGCL
jgi:hypothetical protein